MELKVEFHAHVPKNALPLALIAKQSRSIPCYNSVTYLSISRRTVLRLFIIHVRFRAHRGEAVAWRSVETKIFVCWIFNRYYASTKI